MFTCTRDTTANEFKCLCVVQSIVCNQDNVISESFDSRHPEQWMSISFNELHTMPTHLQYVAEHMSRTHVCTS